MRIYGGPRFLLPSVTDSALQFLVVSHSKKSRRLVSVLGSTHSRKLPFATLIAELHWLSFVMVVVAVPVPVPAVVAAGDVNHGGVMVVATAARDS